MKILGVAFCGACAHEQQAYFAIGELTHEDTEGLRGKALAEMLKIMRQERAGVKETMAAELHHGLARPRAYHAYKQLTSPTARGRVQEFGASICFQIQWF